MPTATYFRLQDAAPGRWRGVGGRGCRAGADRLPLPKPPGVVSQFEVVISWGGEKDCLRNRPRTPPPSRTWQLQCWGSDVGAASTSARGRRPRVVVKSCTPAARGWGSVGGCRAGACGTQRPALPPSRLHTYHWTCRPRTPVSASCDATSPSRFGTRPEKQFKTLKLWL